MDSKTSTTMQFPTEQKISGVNKTKLTKDLYTEKKSNMSGWIFHVNRLEDLTQ